MCFYFCKNVSLYISIYNPANRYTIITSGGVVAPLPEQSHATQAEKADWSPPGLRCPVLHSSHDRPGGGREREREIEIEREGDGGIEHCVMILHSTSHIS